MASYTSHVFHQYTIRIKNGKRDTVHAKLQEMGIASFVYYPVSLDNLPIYNSLPKSPMPNCELCSHEVLSLPIWPKIEKETVSQVAQAIKEAVK